MQIELNDQEHFTVILALLKMQSKAKAEKAFHLSEIDRWGDFPDKVAEERVFVARAERHVSECEALLKRLRLENV